MPWTYEARAGIPDGNFVAFHCRFPFESRPSIQQSSRLTYWYPAACIPLLTKVSATLSIKVSLKLHSHVFHEIQPIGGVAARVSAADPSAAAWSSDASLEPPSGNVPAASPAAAESTP